MRESTIEKYLCKRVKALGGEVRKIHFIGRRSAPDRLILFPHACFWLELKASGKKATAQQEREHEKLRSYGMVVKVADSKEAVDDLLWEFGHDE